jgi:hypothetical protein
VTPENMVWINETCPIWFLKWPEGKCNYIDLDYIDKNYSVSGLNISSGSTIEIGLKDELIYTITYSKNNYILFSLNNNKQAILNKYTVPNDGDYYIVNWLSANSSMDKDTPLTFTLTGNTIDTISKWEHYDDIEYIKIIN